LVDGTWILVRGQQLLVVLANHHDPRKSINTTLRTWNENSILDGVNGSKSATFRKNGESLPGVAA
jgi:hypothetical protein